MGAIWAGALLVVYLGAAGALLLIGHDRVRGGGVALHVLALAALAAATWLPIVPPWLRMWAPLLSLLFLYSELPMLIRAAGHRGTADATVMRWEAALFGVQPARAWAAAWHWRWLSETLHALYASYYAVIFSVPLALWLQRRYREFHDAVFVLMLTFVACFTCYLLWPVAGPRYFWRGDAVPEGAVRAAVMWLLEARSSRGTAFPSSHVAVATCQGILGVHYLGKGGRVIGLLALGIALGAVYGGFHYAIDVIAGAVVGALLAWFGLRLVNRAAHTNASAPT